MSRTSSKLPDGKVLDGPSLTARKEHLAHANHATPSPSTNLPRISHHIQPAMSLSCRYAAQCCARQIRSTPSLRTTAGALAQQRITRRYQSTDAAAAPANPKIGSIVDQISQLTLLETADLVASLKVRGLVAALSRCPCWISVDLVERKRKEKC